MFFLQRHTVAISTLATGVVLSITASIAVRHWEQTRMQLELQRRASLVSVVLERSISSNLEVLSAVKSFSVVSPEFDQDDFRLFALNEIRGHSDIKALSWVPRVLDRQRMTFEVTAQSYGNHDFQITQRNTQDQFVRAARRDDYFPVYSIEPLQGNEALLGFDLASSPAFKAALEQARDSGTPIATARIEDGRQASSEQFSFLVFLPLYNQGGAKGTLAERRQNLVGFFVGEMRIFNLVRGSLNELNMGGIDVYVEDPTAPLGKRLLHIHKKRHGKYVNGSLQELDQAALQKELHATTTIDVAGHQWLLQFLPTTQFFDSQRTWQPLETLVGGLLLTTLLCLYLIHAAQRTYSVKQLVKTRTAELVEANTELGREVKERQRTEELLLQRSRLAALEADVGISLTQSDALQNMLQQCAEAQVRHLNAALVRIWTLNLEEDVLELQASAGMYTHINGRHGRIPVGQFKIGLIAQERQPHLTNRVVGDPRVHDQEWATREGLVAFAGYPLIVEDGVVGVIAMFARQPLPEVTLKAMASVANALGLGIQRKWAEEALLKAKNELEIRVRERTSELVKANSELLNENTERKQAESALRQSEQRFRAIFENAAIGIGLTDVEGRPVEVNSATQKIFGYSSEDRHMSSFADYTHPDDVAADSELFRKLVAGRLDQYQIEKRFICKNGQLAWGRMTVSAVRGNENEILFAVAMIENITERKQAEDKLLHNAFYDVLTDLPNRALFLKHLEAAIQQSQRCKNYLFAVLFLDLDRFKNINDSLGHLVGDQLLTATAKKLAANSRAGDIVARLGGDEFAILLKDIRSVSDATDIANRLQQELSLPLNLNGYEVFTTVSIGIAFSAHSYDNADDILRDADTAMYCAKGLGKARFEIFNKAMHESALTILQLENDLRRAIKHQEFLLHYQPIITLETGRVTGFEALVRWQHLLRGLIAPAEFIPVAEETGLILPIGDWVLREACRQMREWQLRSRVLRSLTISVNISSKQLSQPALVEQIGQILQQTELEAHSLKLELTESALMENAESAAAMLHKLKAMNIQLHMDDFGTGYSSLSYLHRFPVDALKIDRSFVNRIGVASDNAEIVQTIVTLANNLRIDVVAEGVETVDQFNQLRALGCKYGQGYFFSRPLDDQSAAAFIAENYGH